MTINQMSHNYQLHRALSHFDWEIQGDRGDRVIDVFILLERAVINSSLCGGPGFSPKHEPSSRYLTPLVQLLGRCNKGVKYDNVIAGTWLYCS